MTFDPTRALVMAKFKTVDGHNLNRGAALTVVAEPAGSGQVTEGTARRLWNAGIAVYREDFRPTPVETKEQEAARLVAGGTQSPGGTAEVLDDGLLEVPADLVVWQADDEALGRKAGDKVTNGDLVAIAEREEIPVETDANKSALQEAIVRGRAAKAAALS